MTAEPGAAGAEAAPARSRWPALRAVAVWAAGAAVFFRAPLVSRFDTVTGDEGDARLVTFLHEHWWQVLRGTHGDVVRWDTPPVFHPATGVLSYADTFVLDLPVYVPLRLVGVPPLVAFQLCLVALTAVAFASMLRLLRRFVGVAEAPALLLAAAAAFANNLYVDTGHAQMYATCVVPLVALLAAEAWVATPPVRRAVLGGAAGATLGLLTWSSFYIGWFAIVVGLVALAVLLAVRAGAVGATWRAVRERWVAVAAAAGGFAVMMVPFLVTYAPALRDGRGRPYDEVAGLAPRPFDLVNVGDGNLLWGSAVEALAADDARLGLLHRAVAVTPVLAAATLVAGVVLARDARRAGWTHRRTAGVVAAATAAVVALLPIQFGFGGAWSWFHRFVPGGSAIRVWGRIEVLNGFVAVLAVGCLLAARACAGRRGSAVALLPLAIAGLIAVEQINLTDRYRELDRGAQDARFDAVPPPPEACRTFHLAPEPGRDPDHASIDAMWIAQRTGVPTVNGYSGWTPDGWALRPDDAGYEQRVAGWVAANGLTAGHCRYDAATATWSPP